MDLKDVIYVDWTQWKQDKSPNFSDGLAIWAQVDNAILECALQANAAGEAEISLKVRTGGKTPELATEYVPSYKIMFDDVDVPMALDTTKPNTLYPNEFGGCHLGYIKGKVNVPDTQPHEFKLTATRQFGGVDGMYFIDASHAKAREEGYAKGLEDGKAGMYTAEEVQKRVDAAFKEGKGQGVTEGKQKQLDFDNAYTFVLAP